MQITRVIVGSNLILPIETICMYYAVGLKAGTVYVGNLDPTNFHINKPYPIIRDGVVKTYVWLSMHSVFLEYIM